MGLTIVLQHVLFFSIVPIQQAKTVFVGLRQNPIALAPFQFSGNQPDSLLLFSIFPPLRL